MSGSLGICIFDDGPNKFDEEFLGFRSQVRSISKAIVLQDTI